MIANATTPPTFRVAVTYAAGNAQTHEHLSGDQAEQAVGAFVRDLTGLEGQGVRKIEVEIEA